MIRRIFKLAPRITTAAVVGAVGGVVREVTGEREIEQLRDALRRSIVRERRVRAALLALAFGSIFIVGATYRVADNLITYSDVAARNIAEAHNTRAPKVFTDAPPLVDGTPLAAIAFEATHGCFDVDESRGRAVDVGARHHWRLVPFANSVGRMTSIHRHAPPLVAER